MDDVLLSVSDFVALTNQTLECAYPSVSIVGEVAEYRISQGKWVSFKLKDDGAVVNCFAGVYQVRVPLEDGMKVVIVGNPRLNAKGYFSVSLRSVKPVGEGSIKKGFELLKAKLEAEGLFAPERKRVLPRIPKKIGVITSTESAAYADFSRIVNERWGGLEMVVAHTQVQGEPAPDQMIRALNHLNGMEEPPEVIVIIRGGGSAEDLATFNDEPLARAIAQSRVPTLVGVGHEIDHTLADMVADVRAATPTHAAETVIPDRQEIIRSVHAQAASMGPMVLSAIETAKRRIGEYTAQAVRSITEQHQQVADQLRHVRMVIDQLDPQKVLARGYAVVRGEPRVGNTLEIETATKHITAEVTHVKKR